MASKVIHILITETSASMTLHGKKENKKKEKGGSGKGLQVLATQQMPRLV